jgi:transposase-like protein
MQRQRGHHISEAQRAAVEAILRQGKHASEAARETGIGARTCERIRRQLMGKDAKKPNGLGGSAADREIVRLRDEVAGLKRALTESHRETLSEDAIKILLGRIAAAPADPPDWLAEAPPRTMSGRTPEVPSVIWSDWHLGEVVSSAETNGLNAYDPSIADARVKRLVTATIHLCRKHGPGAYPGAVVNLLGDFVSGGLHPELAKTDEFEQIPAALRARDLLIWSLDRMIEAFGRLYVPCTSGNHGRSTPKPEHKRYVFKNFDWLIYQLLARHYEGRSDIVFDIPESNEVHYRVYGLRFLAMHGDMLGVKGGDGIIGSIGPIMRGEVKTRGQATSSGRDYDVLLMGHWHQPLWLPRAIVANSLKGFDEYAKNALRAPPSEPSQPLFFVHPRRGITSRWDVKVEEPAGPAVSDWVSWRSAAA